MSAEANRALIQRFYDEGWNANNLDVYDELVTEDFVDHQAMPGLPPGREGFKMLNVMFRSAFPDVWVNVDEHRRRRRQGRLPLDVRREPTRATSSAFPPTGNEVEVTATVWYRVEDGRLAEGWINRDDFGMMRQLGVIPSG